MGLLGLGCGWCPCSCRRANAPAAAACLPATQDTGHEYTVLMSYVQLYMELIQVRGGWLCLCQCRALAVGAVQCAWS